MVKIGDKAFREVALIDAEYTARAGEHVKVICIVVKLLCKGEVHRLWLDGVCKLKTFPVPFDRDVLFVCYSALAELSAIQSLGLPPFVSILDLFAEYRVLTNERISPGKTGLLSACEFFGVSTITASYKHDNRAIAIRGSPFTDEERASLLDYCQEDVEALERLLPHMLPHIDIGCALIRGFCMRSFARVEYTGIPIDVAMLTRLRNGGWERVADRLIAEVDKGFGVYEGRSFRSKRFERYLEANGIPWPRSANGTLCLGKEVFKDMARMFPQLEPLRQLRKALGQMRLKDLAVGSDGRNRFSLMPFASKTGRNEPRSGENLFAYAAAFRSLAKPAPGWTLIQFDLEQQEFAIAARLSGDEAMQAAYTEPVVEGGKPDPYMKFAIQAGQAPAGATKDTHSDVRERFKQTALAVLFGMGTAALAGKLGCSKQEAAELFKHHRHTYHMYWEWSDRVSAYAHMKQRLYTTFGWAVHVGYRRGEDVNDRSLRNFPMQANGSEMLRLATALVCGAGIRVCATVHDALIVECRTEEVKEIVPKVQQLIARASEYVLPGFPLRSDVKVFSYPDRFSDKRGVAMWQMVCKLLNGDDGEEACSGVRG